MDKVKVLLVGVGGYGEHYLKEFLNVGIDKAELVAIADPFFEKSVFKEEVERRNIPVFSSPEEFFEKGNRVNLTVISSPIHTHIDYTSLALRYKSNVLVEKPVDIEESNIDRLIKEEKESGLFVAVGYQLCFARDVIALKKDILSGMFGKPIRMKTTRMMRRGDIYYSRNGWAGKLKCHGIDVFDSPLANACAHQIENLIYLLGDKMETTCKVTGIEGCLFKGRPSIENFDACSVKIKTDIGVDAYFWTSHSIDESGVGPFSEIEFENATIYEDKNKFKAVFKDGTVKDYSTIDKGVYLQKLYDSIDCCLTGERPSCTLITSKEHAKVVKMAEKLPLYIRYDAVRKETEDGDGYYVVPKMVEQFLEDYNAWQLTKPDFNL